MSSKGNICTSSREGEFKIDSQTLHEINEFALFVCKNMEYNISENVNSSRKTKDTSKRHVAIFLTHHKFVKYDNIDIVIGEIFGKFRTTVIRNVQRVADLSSTGNEEYIELIEKAKCNTQDN